MSLNIQSRLLIPQNYLTFKNKINQQLRHSENTSEPVCESIFIYTCETPEIKNQVSFKGHFPKFSTKVITSAVIPVLTAGVGALVSVFKKKETPVDNNDDVKRIIQNQKDMEYICALKRNFIPHSDFDNMVLENYNKNLDMLEGVNKALIGKIVDNILCKDRFKDMLKDLPADYPDRIKDKAYCLSTWAGDAYTLEENDVEYYIKSLIEYDEQEKMKKVEEAEKAKQVQQKKEDKTTPQNDFEKYFEIIGNPADAKTMSASAFFKHLNGDTTEIENDVSDVKNIIKQVANGTISTDEAISRLKELLDEYIPDINCNCKGADNDNAHEGIISIID